MAQETSTLDPPGVIPGEDSNWPRDIDARLDRLGDAEMDVAVLLGQTRVPLEDVLSAEPGTVYELEKLLTTLAIRCPATVLRADHIDRYVPKHELRESVCECE